MQLSTGSMPPTYQDSLKADPPMASAPPMPAAPEVKVPAAAPSADDVRARFQALVKSKELNTIVADKLFQCLSNCEVVLLCDDSDSMNQALAEEGTDPFAPKRSTRWLELKRLAAEIITVVTAINGAGIDIYFLNRPKLVNVTTPAGLQSVFSIMPNGSTPLVAAMEAIYREKMANLSAGKQLLIVVITDGEPAGHPRETRDNLRQTLINLTNSGRVHVSFAECTDQADDMEYLDQWDGVIKNFDNTDDYREELARVRNVQGAQFKFDFNDYVCKILLATFDRWYFNLDQVKVADTRTGFARSGGMAPVQQVGVWAPASVPVSSGPAPQYYGGASTYTPPAPQPQYYQQPVRTDTAGCGCVIM